MLMQKSKITPTLAQRRMVKTMAALGVSHDLIAVRVGLSETELAEHCEEDLRTALPEMRAMVGASLFAKAKAGNTAAIFFWLKTRASWSETVCREISGRGGGPLPVTPPVRVVLPCNSRNPCPRFERRLLALEQLLLKLRTKLNARSGCTTSLPPCRKSK